MTVNSEFERELEETIGALCKVPPRDLNREFTYTHTHTHVGGYKSIRENFFLLFLNF
jgi:hypothetical protein